MASNLQKFTLKSLIPKSSNTYIYPKLIFLIKSAVFVNTTDDKFTVTI